VASQRWAEYPPAMFDVINAARRKMPPDTSLWGSHIKQTIKRERPNFSETFHGYGSFNELLEDAERRDLLRLQKDAASGGYIVVGLGKK
jgi:hypothetical protein